MLDQIKEFFSNNTIIVVFAVVALVAIVGMFMFKPKSTMQHVSHGTPANTINNMMGECDMETGMCYPQSNQHELDGQEQHMSPEMQQQHHMMQQQQQQQQHMMQDQEQHHMMQEQQMMEEQQMTPEMQQMIQGQ